MPIAVGGILSVMSVIVVNSWMNQPVLGAVGLRRPRPALGPRTARRRRLPAALIIGL